MLQPTDAPPRASRPSLSIPIPPLPPKTRPTGSRPVVPMAPPVLTRSAPPAVEEEPEEISSSFAQPLQDEDGTPRQAHPLEEPEDISSAEIHEAENPETDSREPPESRLNPWFAQLAHGYCPPEGTRFARHTPPTTFPGRDDGSAAGSAPRTNSSLPRVKPS